MYLYLLQRFELVSITITFDIWHFDIVACQWEDGKANAAKRLTDCPDNGQSLESLLNKATEESYCPNS